MTPSWNEDLSVGEKKGDDEHRLQVVLIEALEEIVGRASHEALAERTMEQLLDLSQAHFRSEELLMELHAYAQAEVHAREHGRFVEQLQDIRAKLAAGDTSRALAAIRDWRATMIGHIRSMDQPFAQLETALKYVKSL